MRDKLHETDDQNGRSERRHGPPGGGPPGLLDDPHNRASLARFGLGLALAVFFASLTPPPVVPAAISSLTFLAAMISAAVATARREAVRRVPHFTRWDEAAALMLVSIIAGAMVDPAALPANASS